MPRLRGQTVVTTSTQTGGTPAISHPVSRPPSVRSVPTSAALTDAHKLQRLLLDAERRISELEAKALANLFGSGTLIRGIVVTSGSPAYIQHRLGRAYTGYFVTRIQTNNVTYHEVTLPTNMPSSLYLALQFNVGATVDVFVF